MKQLPGPELQRQHNRILHWIVVWLFATVFFMDIAAIWTWRSELLNNLSAIRVLLELIFLALIWPRR